MINQCILISIILLLSSCGTLTGIPSHGGGKRFAIEQELVSATVRAAVKELDVSAIKGRKITLYITAIGDQGSGNLVGGKYSISTLLRGQSLNSPSTQETATFPIYTTKSTTQTNSNQSTASETVTDTNTLTGLSGDRTTAQTASDTTSDVSGLSKTSINGTSTSVNQVLPAYPTSKTTVQKGSGYVGNADIVYKGIGSYQNTEELIPGNKDIDFLSAAVQTFLYLKGVFIVPPSEAEIDVYLTVDVYGTIRSRIEWFLANNEVLRAKTAVEILAIERENGKIIMPPQVSSYESEYNEQYVLWVGPVNIKKSLRKSDGLLSDYSDIIEGVDINQEIEKDVPLMYPFKSAFD